jgi:IS30 family transposase
MLYGYILADGRRKCNTDMLHESRSFRFARTILNHRVPHRYVRQLGPWPSCRQIARHPAARGKELSAHAQFTLDTGTRVFFADPHSPWQRPTNENTNGLLRQYFPKGTDLSRWDAEDLEAVALALNNRPRKILGWRTPAEVFDEQLRLLQQAGVASTG